MPERKRSKDGTRETEEMFDELGEPGVAGRKGGDLARRKGVEDEEKRAYERPAGATRVTKSEEREGGETDEDKDAG
ncbi:MAG: hypothetical protein ACQEUZ_11700 [Pseudomonadota bacterium]